MNKQVSIKQQIIFSFIPFLSIYAVIRIKKYWMATGLYFLQIGILFASYLLIENLSLEQIGSDVWLDVLIIIWYGVVFYTNIFFIRKWSIEWNKKILVENALP